MAKKVETPVQNIVRFTVGAAEIAAATAARSTGETAAQAFRAFYDAVVVKHDVSLAGLLKKVGERSNEEAAAADFMVRVYWSWLFGEDNAAKIEDRNVSGDTVLALSQYLTPKGNRYKDQGKRQVTQSYGPGSSTFKKDFVGRLIAIGEAIAAEAAGVEAEVETRGAASKKSDKEFVIDRMTAILKRLAKPAEKLDGSVSVDIAPKLGKGLVDLLAAYGIK